MFDPTNGYTAIHADVARRLPAEKISQRYFFESDVLFRLNTLRAVVIDIPMDARYGEEVSKLRISRVVGGFLLMHARNWLKRIFYNYFLRDLSVASLELVTGLGLLSAGVAYGANHWIASMHRRCGDRRWHRHAVGIADHPRTAICARIPELRHRFGAAAHASQSMA